MIFRCDETLVKDIGCGYREPWVMAGGVDVGDDDGAYWWWGRKTVVKFADEKL